MAVFLYQSRHSLKPILMQDQVIINHLVIHSLCLFETILHIEINRRFIDIHNKQELKM